MRLRVARWTSVTPFSMQKLFFVISGQGLIFIKQYEQSAQRELLMIGKGGLKVVPNDPFNSLVSTLIIAQKHI